MLRPCPFCRGKPLLVTERNFVWKEYHVECLNCGAKTKSNFDKTEAIKLWNRR